MDSDVRPTDAVTTRFWVAHPRLLALHVSEIASFVALVDSDGFTAAAESMNLSQGAFSSRIMRLERALGVVLVDRSFKRLTLTSEGRVFHPLAQSLLAVLAAIVDSVDSLNPASAAKHRG